VDVGRDVRARQISRLTSRPIPGCRRRSADRKGSPSLAAAVCCALARGCLFQTRNEHLAERERGRTDSASAICIEAVPNRNSLPVVEGLRGVPKSLP
jgi:hypothetical protein